MAGGTGTAATGNRDLRPGEQSRRRDQYRGTAGDAGFLKARPKGVVVSPGQTEPYVSTGSGNMIAALNAGTLEVPGSVKVGRRVWGIALTRDGSRLYTCDGVSNTVSVVDTGSLTVAAGIEVGEAPWGGVIDD